MLQADAYTGYTKLYLPDRRPGPVTEAACLVHARRSFFAMADVEANARRKARARRRPSSRRSLWKWCNGSMPCSTSSARSTVSARRSERPFVRSGACLWFSAWKRG
ncbi:IS66 family transposase (plasmid) [Sinorhizobium numidicum]|nr:transposase [Sinorhizobium numidicum]WEX79722.1 IS66 family transposase [Sinorhizobium numidicum]